MTATSSPTLRRGVALTLIGVVILGAVVRMWHLGAGSLNFDESFTAMVGRLSLSRVFGFLTAHDSHPPFDYLVQLPLARAGANAFVFRLPAALCSIAALALFAWWMRHRGLAGIAATAAMSICAFQVAHGREARMYAPMELIGVGTAVVAESWLRAPRVRHAVVVGALTFVGLMTHVSMLLVVVGLIALAGRRRDAAAWRWRAGVTSGTAAWALLWGSSFLVQARGGHSSWIPHTTLARFMSTIGSLVTNQSGFGVLVVAAIVAGSILCWHRDRTLAMVLVCCFVVPAVLAGVLGLRAPVLLDRTLTVASWGPLVALGYLVDALVRRARVVGIAAVVVAAAGMLSALPQAVRVTAATVPLAQLEREARSGDVIAVQPFSKGVELYWTLAVRGDDGPARAMQLDGIRNSVALALTGRRPSGRIWLVQYKSTKLDLRHYHLCARVWHHGPTRMFCLEHSFGPRFTHTSTPTIAALAVSPRRLASASPK